MSEVNSFLCAMAVKLIKMMGEPSDGEARSYTFTFKATREGNGVHIEEPALAWKLAPRSLKATTPEPTNG